MNASFVPTDPTMPKASDRLKHKQYQLSTDRPDHSDPCAHTLEKKNVLEAFAERLSTQARLDQIDHDEAEATAMRKHFAAPVGPGPPASDPLKDGLFRGFWLHRHITHPKGTP
ncbi:hypothetical protein [Roseomonas sp. 18066]|uniref:hypothetical protein n=1 Tax=Roseomonas sp. 18066 TaxID=2681412 RepID=UPI00135C7BF0|nr:hypothetical protein [Roseomonas sp. 18066]